MEATEGLKAELLDLCRKTDGGFKTADVPWLGRIAELMDDLAEQTPIANPLASPEIDGRWRAEFVSFGGRAEQGAGIERDSSLMLNSFGKLPNVPIRVTGICQDVDRESGTYSNIVEFTAPDGSCPGELLILGRFSDDPENPKRALVSFGRVLARPTGEQAEEQWRQGLALAADANLEAEFKPPALHSDVVYLDTDVRINIGNMGGNYVLRKEATLAPTRAL